MQQHGGVAKGANRRQVQPLMPMIPARSERVRELMAQAIARVAEDAARILREGLGDAAGQ